MTRITIGPTCWKPADVIPYAALGSSLEGGCVICKSGGTAWIVAPASTQVSTTWYSRDAAVTSAESNAACGDWFVPTCGQLQNPGYSCRTYWDSYSPAYYWSSTNYNSQSAVAVNLTDGTTFLSSKTTPRPVRAFRCVTY